MTSCEEFMLRVKYQAEAKVLLGWDEHCTFWQIVAIETPIRSGPFLTLKVFYWLGDLPELIDDALPDPIKTSLLEAWDKLDGTVNRLAPLEVIDRCRDFLSIVFGHLSGDPTRELSVAIASYVASKKEDMHASAGRIVARLYSRGKPNEQTSKGRRPPTETDAQLGSAARDHPPRSLLSAVRRFAHCRRLM